ncbi:hypothetical protein PISMIDRAFT_683112 [Pisolithus microcarpus 441]|uniref:Uncharacterized protein n=1 Tax=Pisolithus microcarpus 441 TaxID=765257 RepID=A0A0C9ZAH1_9AGAM|nr:hypothetical protein PISMIDRAFT_683112 [Pisolithus microcarpus 441]
MTAFLARSSCSPKKRVIHSVLVPTLNQPDEKKWADDKGSTKRSLVHAGSTEERVCFKEVQLKEKARPPPEEGSSETPHVQGNGSGARSDLHLEMLSGQSPANPVRKRKRGSEKGKEKAVD